MMGTTSTAWKNAALDELTTLLGAGAKLKIRNAADAVLATLTLVNPVAPAASGGVLTLDFDPDITVAADVTGTADDFILTTSGDVEHYQGSAGTSGTELILNTTSLVATENVTIETGTITIS